MASIAPDPHRKASELRPHEASHIFVLTPSAPLPTVDLSNTLAKKLLSTANHRRVTRFMLRYFIYLSWNFRFSALCFAGLLFTDDGPLHRCFMAFMLPSTASLFATILFWSLDLIRLLAQGYEFWFTSAINALNWFTFAVLLSDARVLMAFPGWFSFQVVIAMDAGYRTFPTAMRSILLSIPTMGALCTLVAFRSLKKATFFDLQIGDNLIADAVDIMAFTTSTLAILLAKMFIIKRRKVRTIRGGAGYVGVPCGLIRTRLRLVPLSSSPGRRLAVSQRDKVSRHLTAPQVQQIRLSTLAHTHIDARNTVLPFRFWRFPPTWVHRHGKKWRALLYAIGLVGIFSLSVQSLFIFDHQIAVDHSSPIADECVLTPSSTTDTTLALLGCVCSHVFCASMTLFFQRDILRRLLLNFDYVFSIVQVGGFIFCLADMVCWNAMHAAVFLTWLTWFIWALSLDALTPVIKRDLFRFKKIFALPLFLTMLAVGLTAQYVIFVLRVHGLRNRAIFRIALSPTRQFTLRTKSVLIGRLATISLWCARQMYALVAHKEDELNLIRGLVEYESPYATFPPTHRPAINEDDVQHDLGGVEPR